MEIRTMNTVLNRIFSPTQINDALRATVREIAETWGHDAGFVAGNTARDFGIVFGGLLCSGASGVMATEVTAGAGLVPATRALPIGNALFVFLADDETSHPAELTHSDGDATFDRIDAITVKPASVTDTPGNPSTYPTGATTPAVDLQRGCELTFAVVEGTPAASPTYPTVPTDELVLAYVLVPSGLTAGGGGMGAGGVVYEDFRRLHSPAVRANTVDGATLHIGRGSDFNAFQAQNLIRADGGGSTRSLAWRLIGADNWFALRRNGVDSGDTTADLYPMMIAGSRSESITYGWGGGHGDFRLVDNGGLAADDTGLRLTLTRSNSAAQEDATFSVDVPASDRGLELTAMALAINVQTVFNGTITTAVARLKHVAADGTVTTLDTWDFSASLLATGQTVHSFSFATTKPTAGERYFVDVNLDLAASNTTGILHLERVTATFNQGRV